LTSKLNDYKLQRSCKTGNKVENFLCLAHSTSLASCSLAYSMGRYLQAAPSKSHMQYTGDILPLTPQICNSSHCKCFSCFCSYNFWALRTCWKQTVIAIRSKMLSQLVWDTKDFWPQILGVRKTFCANSSNSSKDSFLEVTQNTQKMVTSKRRIFRDFVRTLDFARFSTNQDFCVCACTPCTPVSCTTTKNSPLILPYTVCM